MSGNDTKDTPMTRFLFAILQQKSLKDINWDKVAEDPILVKEISNGHAARMRYSRFRTYMESLQPRRRNCDPNAKNKVSKPKKGPKVKRGGGLASVKQDPEAPQGPTIKYEDVATLSAAASAATVAATAVAEAGEPTQQQRQPDPSQFPPYTTTTARFAHSSEAQVSVSMAATQQQQHSPPHTTIRLLTPTSDAGDIHHHHHHHQLALNPNHPVHNHHRHMQPSHSPSASPSPTLAMSPIAAWHTSSPVGGLGMTTYAPSNFDAAFDSIAYAGVREHHTHGEGHGHGGGIMAMEGGKQEEWESHFPPVSEM